MYIEMDSPEANAKFPSLGCINYYPHLHINMDEEPSIFYFRFIKKKIIIWFEWVKGHGINSCWLQQSTIWKCHINISLSNGEGKSNLLSLNIGIIIQQEQVMQCKEEEKNSMICFGVRQQDLLSSLNYQAMKVEVEVEIENETIHF